MTSFIQKNSSEIGETLLGLSELVPLIEVETTAGATAINLRSAMIQDIPRIVFQLELLAKTLPKGATIVDFGGGVNLFGLGALELGFNFVLVDDFSDRWHDSVRAFLDLEVQRGVQIINADIRSEQLVFPEGSIDAVTSFDCLEHLPFSPKPILHKMKKILRPGGLMFIGVPNCVNLRKRISVPFGFGKWSDMKEWYEDPVFRGHIREPDVDDLRYIARDLDLIDVRIKGKNWLGYSSRYKWARIGTPFIDRFLQIRPSLCSNIYLLGAKRAKL